LLLILVVAAGQALPGLGLDLLPADLPVPGPAIAAHDALAAVAGETVLVAFDYTPAKAGELDPLAELMLRQLAENGSPVLAVTLQPTGVALAERLIPDRPVYYVPGEAIGLRRLAGCVGAGGEVGCPSVGDPEALADVALALIITGDRDSLINWVSQVGATTDLPLVVGVTQALAPVAAPFIASGELVGSLDGAPAVAAYSQQYADAGAEGHRERLSSQAVGVAVTVVVLVIANLFGGLAAIRASRRRAGVA
jgi:hypothetical protein